MNSYAFIRNFLLRFDLLQFTLYLAAIRENPMNSYRYPLETGTQSVKISNGRQSIRQNVHWCMSPFTEVILHNQL